MGCWMITGAGRGIGLGLTRQLIERGDEVIALLRDPSRSDALQSLAKGNARLTILSGDVTDQASLVEARQALGKRRIDVLVNNAGIYRERNKGVLDGDLDAFAETLMVNTVAPLRVLQVFAPLMMAAGRTAKAVTISSAMGSFAGSGAGQFTYRASKAAINKAVQSLSGELLEAGIIAFVMHPGWVRTDMGGSSADLSVETSAAGLIAVIDQVGRGQAGAFLNYDGATIPW